ncbi:hypothetical protein N7456_001160 [Penicillium angulare]|uniref:Rhodopsin domain-containing protein n=1 Tax=Penicillium angulare TaxID=116970 RepID=A0A9W9GDW4_9EURO|nr:hypothetical protein N7456_001160 [Penicillium angulare]
MMFKLVFAMEFIYSSTIPAIKMSVLMFYRRIFPIRRFSYALYGCAFLALGWFIGVMVVNFVQCFPYAYFWKQYGDPNAKGKCIAVEDYFMGNGIAEAITDFIILVTPFYQVWKLQMPTSQKIAVSAIFGLGFFTCVAGALRCYAVYLMNENEDITWNFGRGFIWSSIEPSCGIISACLPTLRPLLRHFFPTAFGNSSHQKSSEFHPLSDRTNFGPGEGLAPQNDIRGGSSDSSAPLGSKQDPHHAIMVRQEFMFSTKSDEHEHA